ncbi:hypothetical protein H5410_015068 [Solanum commersonii]|uniref:Uncharacterized protein n=1 Tax=Solanum commersonii TaxID=4109 RepID=A0A9J5ZTA7_SOLCO|nr:hypothetical protein H5410_015068 [Solanum commersonii]
MVSASHTNDDNESRMAGEAQSVNSNEEIDIDALLKRLQEQVEKSSSNTTCKGKGKMMRPSWSPPSRRGRGRTGAGRGNILAQMGNQKLVASNIASTSGLNTDHPMYKEFLDYMQSKQGKDNVPPSYSPVLVDEETTKLFDQNDKKEAILLVEYNDLRWKNDPWQLMSRYLNSVSYTTHAYKYRMHYETILSATRSSEFQHFYPPNTRKVYNFSNIIIKRVLTLEEWGMSPLKENDYIHPEQKIAITFNY